MALLSGSVTIDPNGNPSGTGLAMVIFTALVSKYSDIPPGPSGAGAKRQLADLCNAVALVADYIVANAQVSITAIPGGLQSFVAPPAGPAPTGPPLTPIALTGNIL
ncbi:MAG: hypothetical protein ACOY0T_37465 [Myxococcota bacterium]